MLLLLGSAAATFVTLDRFDATSRAAVGIAYVEPAAPTFGPNTRFLLHADAHVRYVDPRTGFGGYLQVPFGYEREKDYGFDPNRTDVGDVEVGGIYARGDVVLHAGVALPSGEGDREGEVGYYESHALLRDLYDAVPHGLSVRAGASWLYRHGALFARADLGVDWNLTGETDITVGKGVHYNAGIGIDLDGAAVMLECDNLSILDEPSGDRGPTQSHTTLDTLALTARADAGAALPFVAVVLPLEEDTSHVFGFAVIGGADFKL